MHALADSMQQRNSTQPSAEWDDSHLLMLQGIHCDLQNWVTVGSESGPNGLADGVQVEKPKVMGGCGPVPSSNKGVACVSLHMCT